MNNFNINIIAALMVKNEEKRILVSLNSIKTSVSGVALYDTGSEDKTVYVVEDFCNKNNIKFFLLTGQFEDFSTSRNKLLDFINEINNKKRVFDYVLLLDSNDEYRGVSPLPDILRDEIVALDINQNPVEDAVDATPRVLSAEKDKQFEGNKHVCFKIKQRKSQNSLNLGQLRSGRRKKKQKNKSIDIVIQKYNTPDAFMVKQRWFVGSGRNDLCYFNIKIVKPNKGFIYVEPVHEYIKEPGDCNIHKIIDKMEIYQDRVADNDGKTRNRWENDAVVLTKVLQNKPNDSRTQYYMAQTYECLENKTSAYKYYKTRAQNSTGFFEEKFLSMMKCGYLKQGYAGVCWFLKAYDFLNRAEPLVELAKFFRNKREFQLAFAFSKMACDLQIPEQTLLWSCDKTYNHDRWQELSISAYYVQQFAEGEDACKKALESPYDKDLNIKNLDFYILQKKTECKNGLQKP
jgi:hypothetical protein